MITTPDQAGGRGDGAWSRIARAWDAVGRGWDRFTAPTERYRRPFRKWRRGRPFAAGICVLLAALEIPLVTQSAVGKLLSMGIPGISTLFIAVFLGIFAVTIWFFPAYRVFSGIAAIMVALLSLVATNLGGFLLGFLLAMFGGAFAVAWTPRADYTADTRRQRRAAARAARQSAAAEAEPGHQGTQTAGSVALAEAEPASHPDAEDTFIEQYARPDEAAEAAPEPSPEEE